MRRLGNGPLCRIRQKTGECIACGQRIGDVARFALSTGLRFAGHERLPKEDTSVRLRELLPVEVGLRDGAAASAKSLPYCRSIQAVSVSPAANALAPAPADQGLLPSTARPAVRSRGSVAMGTHSGHSKPSATFLPVHRTSTTSSTKPPMTVPWRCWSASTTAHPKLPRLMDPMSAQKIAGLLTILALVQPRSPCRTPKTMPSHANRKPTPRSRTGLRTVARIPTTIHLHVVATLTRWRPSPALRALRRHGGAVDIRR